MSAAGPVKVSLKQHYSSSCQSVDRAYTEGTVCKDNLYLAILRFKEEIRDPSRPLLTVPSDRGTCCGSWPIYCSHND